MAHKLLFDLYLSEFQWTWPIYKILASHDFFPESKSSKQQQQQKKPNYYGSKNIKKNTWFQISSNYEQVTLLHSVWGPRKL